LIAISPSSSFYSSTERVHIGIEKTDIRMLLHEAKLRLKSFLEPSIISI
jgi:hypothetical protein